MSNRVERVRALTDHVELVCSWNEVFSGEVGNLTCDGRIERSADRLGNMDDSRSWRVGLGGGAMNAMEKSVSPDGEDGVTMIAGSGAFSSTKGSVRSRSVATQSTNDNMIKKTYFVFSHRSSPNGAGIRV